MLADSSYYITCFKLLEPIRTLNAWAFAHAFLEIFLRFWQWLEFIARQIYYLSRLRQESWVLPLLSCQGIADKAGSFEARRIDLLGMIIIGYDLFLVFIIIRIWSVYDVILILTIWGTIKVSRISYIILLFYSLRSMLRFGLRNKLEPLVTRVVVWRTLLALDHVLSS